MIKYLSDKNNLMKTLENAEKDDKICLFYKKEEQIPISICENLIKKNIQFIQYEAKDEILFHLGAIVSGIAKDEILINVNKSVPIPEKISIDYNIKNTISGKQKRKTKTVRSKIEIAPKKQLINETIEDSTDQPDAKEIVKSVIKPVSEKKQVKKNPDVSEKAENSEKSESKPKSVNKKIITLKTQVAPEKVLSKEPVKTVPSIIELKQVDLSEYDKQLINKFIKQMGVRALDIKYKGTDENLASEIAKILIQASDKELIRSELEQKFGETHTTTIMKWIQPNLRKLTELAKEIIL